ncbi:formate--tetrahydrofolate ligase [Bartonella quintana]|nr:formate--tetrahydrofolate ligase [Bartonella quintana]
MLVREVCLSASAGFIVIICGDIAIMLGLPNLPCRGKNSA